MASMDVHHSTEDTCVHGIDIMDKYNWKHISYIQICDF
jgi:hypothetical protein